MLLKNICTVEAERNEMANTIPLYRTSFYIVLMAFFSLSLAAPGEHPGVLSRLYKQASKQNRPLIIVLDNSDHGKTKEIKHKTSVEVDNKMSLPYMYMYQFDQNSQPAKQPVSKLLEDEHDKVEKRPDKKRVKQRHQLKTADDKRFLRSPVIKSLLRISNSLRCEAKNDCADECGDRYRGQKRDECEDECEIKYSCEESVEEKDDCENSNSCEEHQMSTQGERLVTETPKCKRC